MNIAFVTSRYPSKNNPYNHMFVHMRCIEMIKQGYKVKVYVPSNKKDNYVYEGVDVFKMPSNQMNDELLNQDILYLHLLNIYPFTKVNGWDIYKFILANNLPFVMYVHGSEVQKYGARIFEFRYRITDFLKWFKKDILVIPKMTNFVIKTNQRKNAAFVFPSKWMKENMEHNLKLNLQQNYYIIPNGIETDFFEYQDSIPFNNKIISIRSLSQKVYDIEKTVEVLSFLPEKYSLDIYGEGIYKNYYLKLIKEKNISHRIRIIPTFVEKVEMKKLFSQHGFYISTTKMDSQGINMMEAMSAGLIVATIENSSKKEFITGFENGILGTSAKSIAEQIVEISNNSSLFRKIAIAGRASMEKIDIKKTVSKELIVLKEVSSING